MKILTNVEIKNKIKKQFGSDAARVLDLQKELYALCQDTSFIGLSVSPRMTRIKQIESEINFYFQNEFIKPINYIPFCEEL
jgi:hypothetical protein